MTTTSCRSLKIRRAALAATITFVPAATAVVLAQASQPGPSASRPASAPASAAAQLAAAQRLILQGQYDKAEEKLAAADADAALAVAVSLARVDIDERRGRYRDAIGRLDRVKSAGETSAAWHAAYAGMLAEVGEYEAAIEHGEKALKLDAGCYRARYQLGRVYELLGRDKDALTTYKWFDDVMKRKLPDRADELTYLGRGFLRYSTLVRHPDMLARTKHTLQEVYQEAFDFVDAEYWPARLAAAELLLEKHNSREAESDFAKVRQVNAAAFEAEVGLARVALENWDFELAEKRIDAALQINPNSTAAHIVLTQVRMTQRRYADAAESARAALKVNPNHLEALSLLAAAQLRHEDLDAAKATQNAITKLNPRPAILHHTLGVWLSAARQYEDAESNFRKAIEFAPWWAEPRIELGLMLMQSGDEAAARDTLDACQAMDPYNQAAFNTLTLLDELEAYARHETEHFVFRYSQDQDSVIIPFMAEYCEKMQKEVCDAYGVTLKRKTIIEVMPTHGNFSVRIAGRPWIHTVGACTGCVIAIDAPRKTPGFEPFNWSEVLRHEFTHTVTLAATGNRIPHWMTEGISVYQEESPKSWSYREMLSAAVRTDTLFSLESIDWGFMRPRRANDRALAYAQSEWFIEYIVERWSRQAVIDLLRCFRDRRTLAAAWNEVLKTSPEAFVRDFKPWAAKQVLSWGLPAAPVGDIVKLRAAALVTPRDAKSQALLAEAAWYDEDMKLAESAARAALKADKEQPLANTILGRLLVLQAEAGLRKNDDTDVEGLFEEAHRCLRRAHQAEPANAAALKYLAKCETYWKRWDVAGPLWEEYARRCPDDPDSYRIRGGIALNADERQVALALLERLWELDNTDADVARQVAKLHADAEEWAEAAKWWLRAIYTQGYDADSYERLAEALEHAKDLPGATRAFEAVALLRKDSADALNNLARLWELRGDPAKAAEYRKKARVLQKDPNDDHG